MDYRKLGRTGLKVSELCLGCMAFGPGIGFMKGISAPERRAFKILDRAVDRGINFLDTADIYQGGISEEIVGRWLTRRKNRDAIVLATKMRGRTGDGPNDEGLSRKHVMAACEASLRRLRTDFIDLYQVHWPDPKVPIEETAGQMSRFVEEGKIRAAGVSNYSSDQMDSFARGGRLSTAQPPYNLFERGIDKDILPYCRDKGIVLLTYGALCRGLLSGRMKPDTEFAGDDLRKWDPKFQEPRYGHYLDAVNRLDAYAKERHGKTVMALAVRWILDRGVEVALWGGRHPSQLDAVEEAMGWSLSEEAFQDIGLILAESIPDPVGPEFMAPPARP